MFGSTCGCIILDLNCPEFAFVDEEYNEDISDFERSYIFKTETHMVKVDKYQLDMYVKYHFNVVECSSEARPSEARPSDGCNKRSVHEWCKECYGVPKVESLTCFDLTDLPAIYINKIEVI